MTCWTCSGVVGRFSQVGSFRSSFCSSWSFVRSIFIPAFCSFLSSSRFHHPLRSAVGVEWVGWCCWVHTSGLAACNARINVACWGGRGKAGWGGEVLWDRWVLSYCGARPLIFRELCFPRKVNTSRLLSLISTPSTSLLLQPHLGICSPREGERGGGGERRRMVRQKVRWWSQNQPTEKGGAARRREAKEVRQSQILVKKKREEDETWREGMKMKKKRTGGGRWSDLNRQKETIDSWYGDHVCPRLSFSSSRKKKLLQSEPDWSLTGTQPVRELRAVQSAGCVKQLIWSQLIFL